MKKTLFVFLLIILGSYSSLWAYGKMALMTWGSPQYCEEEPHQTPNKFQSHDFGLSINYVDTIAERLNPVGLSKLYDRFIRIDISKSLQQIDPLFTGRQIETVHTPEKKLKYFVTAVFFIGLAVLVVVICLLLFFLRAVQRKTEELSIANKKLMDIEEQFSLAMDFANVGLYDRDLITNTIYFSPVWKRMLGYEPDELENKYSVWQNLTAPDDVAASLKMMNELVDGTRGNYEIELFMKHKDGHWIEVLSRANVVRNSSGKAVRVLGTHVDITRQKDSERFLAASREKLKKQEELFKSVFQNIPIMITIYDAPVKKLIVNKEFEKTTGWTADDAKNGDLMEKVYPDPVEREKTILFMKSGSNEWRELEITSKEGKIIYSLWSNVKLDDNRRLNIGLDLTEQKKGKKALFDSEMKFKRMFEYAPLSYQSLDKSGNFIDVNETWLQTMGYDRYEVIGKNFSSFLRSEWKNHFAEYFPRFKAVGEILGVEFEMKKKDGTIILVSFHGRIGRDQDGHFERTHCILNDITLQRDSEELLKSELAINKAVAEISKALLTEDYDIQKVSNVTLELAKSLSDSEHGFVASLDKKSMAIIVHTMTDMIGAECSVSAPQVSFPIGEDGKYNALWGHALNTKKAFFTNEPDDHEESKGTPEGHIQIHNYLAVPVAMGDSLLGLIALSNSERGYSDSDLHAINRLSDVFALGLYRAGYEKERKELEQSLRQLQKNEAIGALAGGIAHDFNNILFPIVGFAEMIAEDLPEDSTHYESINEILSGALRAKDLVKQILAFSKQAETEIKPIKPQTVINEVVKLIRATIPVYIEIKQNIDPSVRTIMADTTQIHQIAMNLITNAYQAISADEGTITVNLSNIDLDETTAGATLQPGPYVLLSIGDTGSGMGESILDRIFDPYFSTKALDKGTGLGLSVVHGIVKNYGGDIVVSSSPGKGSEFYVYFPALTSSQATEAEQKIVSEIKGQGKILLVDDEPNILRLVKQLLERLGYEIDVTASSEHALEMVRLSPDLYDLIITDMTMPKMTGEKLTQEIKKIKASLPVIICTGFSERIDQDRVRDIGAQGFLMKPVVKADLGQMVRRVLEGESL